MGVVADGVLSGGGEVIGILSEALKDVEGAHPGLTELHIVSSMHERKAMMARLADAFVALPGGIGTFEDLFEAWTWSQLGVHSKPCALLNVTDFYDHLVTFLDHVVHEAFLKLIHRHILVIERAPTALLHAICCLEISVVPKRFDEATT